jgi:hypothetical protein
MQIAFHPTNMPINHYGAGEPILSSWAAYATRNGPYSRTNKLKPNRPPKKLIFYSLHRSIGRFATIGLHNISQPVLI